MGPRAWIFCGGLLGCLGVLTGAFGAHYLNDVKVQTQLALTAKDLNTFEVAVRYQMYHAGALVLVGLLGLQSRTQRWTNLAGASFLCGTVIFSGLLYALVFSHIKPLGAIVPIGGLSLAAGWIFVAIAGSAIRENWGLNN